jgi:hypothetical protein
VLPDGLRAQVVWKGDIVRGEPVSGAVGACDGGNGGEREEVVGFIVEVHLVVDCKSEA